MSEAKLWMRVDGNDEDALIISLITAAREAAEKYTRRAFITQTWNLTVDLPSSRYANNLPGGVYDMPISSLYGELPQEIKLPYPELISVTSVKTYDTSNTESTYSASNYIVDTANSRIVLNDTAVWPSNLRGVSSALITYVCGYGTSDMVPSAIKMGIKMHVKEMYDSRSDQCGIPPAASSIYRQYRVYCE